MNKFLICELASNAKIWEHEQASTRLNFASKSTKGKIFRAVKNFNGPFITPIKENYNKKRNNNKKKKVKKRMGD